jgi:hypothetical protein
MSVARSVGAQPVMYPVLKLIDFGLDLDFFRGEPGLDF